MEVNTALESPPPNKEIKFDIKESFELSSDDQKFLLKIFLNENLIFFEVEEFNIFPKKEFNIYLSLEQLGKINKYFLQFDSLNEVLQSLKTLINKKNLTIIKEEKLMKIKITNPGNDKVFFINIPYKEKDLKSEIDSIIPYVASLNEKIQFLEKKVNSLEKKLDEIYIYKNILENIKKEKEEKEEKEKKLGDLVKSKILLQNEYNLLMSWLDNIPKTITLLLDSDRDGDLTDTFYSKCSGKCPTIVLVQTIKNIRFGGYSSIPWKNQNQNYSSDKNNFIFSLDKKEKYKIIKPENAIQTYSEYFAFGSGSDFYVHNNCKSYQYNYVNGSGTYDKIQNYELNGGEQYFTVSRYEVYQIEY